MPSPRFLLGAWALGLVLLPLCGPCKPDLSPEEAATIVRAARAVEARFERMGCLETDDIPPALEALGADSVCRSSRGVRITIWTRFVETRGFYVPALEMGSNPPLPAIYERLHPALYWFDDPG